MTFGRANHAAHRTGVRRELVIFYGAAALALAVVAFGAVVASRSVARAQALTDAERMTTRMANLVVAPLLESALSGDQDAYDDLTRAIEIRMRDGYLRQVTVWDHDGRIIFADDPAEVGQTVQTPPEVVAAIDRRETTADFTAEPEATSLTSQEMETGFVEVYVPFEATAEAAFAFEAYYDYARVDETADGLLRQLIPLVLIPLVILMAIQLPIATSMARRVRRHDSERSELAERSLAVSERERIRIAADLHDGPIQDLAGMGYALGAVAMSVPDRHHDLMQKLQTTVQRSVESLRQLMVDLYPPDLSGGRLPESLANLAAPLQEKGIAVDLVVGSIPELSPEILTTLYRVANEALANTAEHSSASTVKITVGTIGPPVPGGKPGQQAIRLQIADDGTGFDLRRMDRRSEGHLGLRLLTSRVEGLRGTLNIRTGPGGTTVEATLPLAVPQSD